MDRDVNLGRASREELVQLVSQLLDHVEALEGLCCMNNGST